MTLDAALVRARQFLAEVWEEHEAAFLQHLADAGATDDEMEAARTRSRETFARELRTACEQVTAVWFTGDAGIH